MSRASEWADGRRTLGPAPRFHYVSLKNPFMNLTAWVSDDGSLSLTQTGTTEPESALALAAWLREVYGEPEVTP